MIRTVIVGLDGSELAEEALPYAIQIVQHTEARLQLCQVLPPDASAALKAAAETYLREIAHKLDHVLQISIRLGKPAEELLANAQAVPEPIIVMTTHGRGGIGRLMWGSVADQVFLEADVPLLLIRSGMAASTHPIRRILVPLDGSAYAEAALPYAQQLTQAFDADLWLIQVIETTEVSEDLSVAEKLAEKYGQMRQEANAYLNTIADQLREEGLRVHPQVRAGFVEDELLRSEDEAAAHLVMLASHGRSGQRRILSRSLAERLLRLGRAPVLTVRPSGMTWTEGLQREIEAPQTTRAEEVAAEDASRTKKPEPEVAVRRNGQGGRWQIDPAHSEIEFAIRHLMISTIKGRFNQFNGSLQFDETHLDLARVEVEIDAASLDTGQEQRDLHLRSGDFFDVETYPTIRFFSRQVESLGGNHFRVLGDLRLHGVTRSVVLEVTFEGVGPDPWGRTRCSFTATTQLKRTDFGLTWNQPLATGGVMVGEMVRIVLDIQAVKQG